MKLYESKAPMEIMIFAFALKFMILPHFFSIICQPNILSCCWIMTGWCLISLSINIITRD